MLGKQEGDKEAQPGESTLWEMRRQDKYMPTCSTRDVGLHRSPTAVRFRNRHSASLLRRQYWTG